MPVLAVARLWFEGNAFSPLPTGADPFAAREWARGEPALAAARGTATELAAVTEFAAARPDWTARVSRCASANPGGLIVHAVYEAFCDEVLRDFAVFRPDAIYLSLHGAALTDRLDTPELDLLARVRAAHPAVPLAASFDLHANLPSEIVRQLDFATGYRTYPHIDMRETAARALDRLAALAGGAPRPHGVVLPLGLKLPSFNMRSAEAPMAPLLVRARAREVALGAGADISLFGGFPYADTPTTGASVMVWAATAHAASDTARSLASDWRACADAFAPRLTDPAAGLAQAAALLAAQSPPESRLVAVTDPADNPLSGGAADTPGLLRALLAARTGPAAPLAALRDGEIVFAYLFDPALVARARAAGPGALLEVRIGARLDARFGAPVVAQARMLRLVEASFRNRGPMEHGAAVSLGDAAVLEVAGVQVIVTSAVGAANDPAFFAAVGVDLAATRLLCVKAKNHFRAAFASRCAAIIDVDCPGPAAADIDSLPRPR